MILGGFICQHLQWEYLFYLSGGICIIWSIIWQIFIYESPEADPRISEDELDYIIKNRSPISKDKKNVPWSKVLTSMPVMALVLSQYTCQWIIYLVFSLYPSFLRHIFHLDVQLVGLLSALPGKMYKILKILLGFFKSALL